MLRAISNKPNVVQLLSILISSGCCCSQGAVKRFGCLKSRLKLLHQLLCWNILAVVKDVKIEASSSLVQADLVKGIVSQQT